MDSNFKFFSVIIFVLMSCLKVEAVWLPVCEGLEKNLGKMFKCCNIFGLSYESDKRENCAMECINGENEDPCCFDRCFAEMSGIYKNKFFNKTAMMVSFIKGGAVGPEGIQQTEKSIEKCTNEIPIKSDIGDCGILRSVLDLTRCVFIENYLNCPNLDSPECQKLGKPISPCQKIKEKGAKTTTMVITTVEIPTAARVTRAPSTTSASKTPSGPRNGAGVRNDMMNNKFTTKSGLNQTARTRRRKTTTKE